jgi:hypothetical protein
MLLMLGLFASHGPLFAQEQGVSLEALLAQGREYLTVGNLDGARKVYGNISVKHPIWPQKIRDLSIWHLLNGRSREAWRVLEVGRQVGVSFPEEKYLRVLTAALDASCLFEIETGHPLWNLLLNAHVIRYAAKFHPSEDGIGMGTDETRRTIPVQIGVSQAHHLEAIPKARPLKGRGCDSIVEAVYSGSDSATLEYAVLKSWYALGQISPENARESIEMEGADSVRLRLADMAIRQKDLDLAGKVLAPLAERPTARWLELTQGEQRYLFQKLREANNFSQKPLLPSNKEGQLAFTLIMAGADPATSTWLDLLDRGQWPLKDVEKMLTHLLSIKDVQGRPYLLLWQARLKHRSGDHIAALAILRRLLIAGEAEGYSDVETKALSLTYDLFVEYRYNQKMLAMIQNSIPFGHWQRLYKQLAVDHALRGDSARFIELERLVTSPSGDKSRRLTVWRERDILVRLAQRSHSQFRTSLAKVASGRRLGAQFLSFLSAVATRAMGFSPEERRNLRPYFSEIERVLRQAMGRGEQDPRMMELASFFGADDPSAYQEGRDLVRQGTNLAGVVDLSKEDEILWQASFQPPRSLPTRSLLVMPKGVGEDGWRIY